MVVAVRPEEPGVAGMGSPGRPRDAHARRHAGVATGGRRSTSGIVAKANSRPRRRAPVWRRVMTSRPLAGSLTTIASMAMAAAERPRSTRAKHRATTTASQNVPEPRCSRWECQGAAACDGPWR